MDLILFCLPGRIGYAVTHEDSSSMVLSSRGEIRTFAAVFYTSRVHSGRAC